jgi:biotin carboxylase
MRTLWVVGGGIEAVPGIRLAREMGLHVVVSDRDSKAPGCAVAGDCVVASTYDVQATIAAAQRYHRTVRPLDGVMCIATDVAVTVASVAAALDLPGIPIASAHLAADKLAMKHRFAAENLPVPWFSPVDSVEDLRRIVAERDYPVVLKPVDSRGARGVLRLTPGVDLEWAYRLSHRHSPTGRVMIEQFLSGPQISTETMVLDGVAHTPGFSDRNYEYLEKFAPHIIENGGELPSHLPPALQQAVRDVVQRAACSMGITNGVVKGDVVVCDGEPYVIELAARLSGGYFCSHEIPLSTGVSFVEQAIRLALGESLNPSELVPRFQRGVAQRYLFPEPGRVTQISGVEETERCPGIAFCEVRVTPGDIVGTVDSHPARAGVVIATGDTRQEAMERAIAAVTSIKIETVPV